MTKLILRFFIFCIAITLLSAPIILYIQSKIDYANGIGNIKLVSEGKFSLLDKFLSHYPQQQWQTVLDQLRPETTYRILVVPINQLNLSKNQLVDLKQNKFVYVENNFDMEWPTAIYKRIANSPYVYKHIGGFDGNQEAHRVFDWQELMILKNLQQIPENQWNTFLKKTSPAYGYPITSKNLNDLSLSAQQKQRLLNKEWVIDLPNKDDSIQILYTSIPNSNKILQFGPMYLPFVGVYEKYLLFAAVLLIIEIIMFIAALLFARSLEKLKRLAHDYGQGDFSKIIVFSKTSTLYSLYNDLRLMGDRIKSLLNSHKELTNTVAHELRTPISRLCFSVELLKNSSSETEKLKRITAIEEDIQELEELVSEILTYATLDRISPKFELSPIKLNELAIVVRNKISPLLRTENRLTISLPNEIAMQEILADNKYLLRALLNLIQNANNYASSHIKLSFTKNDNNIFIIIEDDGPGILDQDKKKLFDPFIRINHFQSNEISGYGLGLAITKKIIEAHKWKINISDSNLGGAKFTIII